MAGILRTTRAAAIVATLAFHLYRRLLKDTSTERVAVVSINHKRDSLKRIEIVDDGLADQFA